MKINRISAAVVLAIAAAAALAVLAEGNKGEQQMSALRVEGELQSFSGANGWINSEALTDDDLRGKVVLVQFWTYSCINWLRTEPYVRAWAEKYKDKGLVVVGVHSPEFGFEKNADNVQWATKNLKVDYPVAIDSDHAIWNAFGNQYWPALYFVDAKGNIRHHQFGEGDYERSEQVIQELLTEAGNAFVGTDLIEADARGIEAAADWATLKSAETYLGYARTENFSSLGTVATDRSRSYEIPSGLRSNHWALSGEWTIGREAIASNVANGRIAYRFHSRDVHMVLGPSVRGKSVRFRVLIDGKPPGAAHGGDVDEQGNGALVEQRLYQLVRQHSPIEDRLFEIEFLDPGAEGFSFTFG